MLVVVFLEPICMAYAVVLTAVPEELTAGESVSWSWFDSRFPASDGWVLTYTLVNASVQIQIVAAADGDKHLVEIGKAVSDAYTVGSYEWQAHVDNGTERYQVAVGVIKIVADFADQTSGLDTRTHVKKVLDLLEAAIEGRASKTQLMQMVGGVQVQYMTLDELTKQRDKYAAKYRQEQIRAGQVTPSPTIKPRFTN